MKKSQVLKFGFLSILCANLLCVHAIAQGSFRYKAALDTVLHDGFYAVPLSPVITAECQFLFGDLRVKNESGKEVPYYLLQEQHSTNENAVSDLPLIKTNNLATIVVNNESGTGTRALVLHIKNSAANRMVTVSGSDDTSHWYVIKEHIVLANDNSENNKTSFDQTIEIPFSNYRYYQVRMQGKDSLPLNIFGAGLPSAVVSNRHTPPYNSIPAPVITQHDSSNKKSYIKLQFNNHYRIDQLKFSLKGAKFFNRSFNLYSEDINSSLPLLSNNITSGSFVTVDLHEKTNALWLVINNYDNPPLQIATIAAYQMPVSIIAYLDSGKKYDLFFGDSLLQSPTYDLKYFLDSFHNSHSTVIAVKNIELVPARASAEGDVENHISTWLLWSIIIAVLLLLIYFSYTLLKDINLKNNDTNAHL